MDNILVFTKMIKEHRQVMIQVMKILLHNDLFLKPTKCHFEVNTVKYLRFIISIDQISMDLVKIDGIFAWPTPTNLKEVQLFLGFGNFYRWFIWDFTIPARPFNDLTKKTPYSYGLTHVTTHSHSSNTPSYHHLYLSTQTIKNPSDLKRTLLTSPQEQSSHKKY